MVQRCRCSGGAGGAELQSCSGVQRCARSVQRWCTAVTEVQVTVLMCRLQRCTPGDEVHMVHGGAVMRYRGEVQWWWGC